MNLQKKTYKEEKGEKIEKYFLYEKNDLLRMEKEAFLSNERLSLSSNNSIVHLKFRIDTKKYSYI